MKNSMKILLGVSVGVMAGAITGLLVAPESGKKTRKKISTETDRLLQSLNETVAEVAEGTKSTYNSLKRDVVATAKDKSEKVNELKAKASSN